MIDTDKYEGHTPGPWKQGKPKNSNPRIITQFCDDEIIVNTCATSWEADIQLIADAPLFLEEVKRLRDLVEFAIAAIDSNHCYMGEEAQVDLRDYLKEMIE